MNNERWIIAHSAFFILFYFYYLQVNTPHCALELKAISPTAKHATPKCSNKQWDDASILACSALKGFPYESVLKAKDLQSAYNGNGQNYLIKWHQNQFINLGT